MNLPNTALHQFLNWHAVTSVRGRNRFLPVRIFVWKWIYSFTRLAASSWDNLTVDSASVLLEVRAAVWSTRRRAALVVASVLIRIEAMRQACPSDGPQHSALRHLYGSGHSGKRVSLIAPESWTHFPKECCKGLDGEGHLNVIPIHPHTATQRTGNGSACSRATS